MILTRRQWLRAATMLPACLALRAARKEFWDSKDPATWSSEEKQLLLGQSPWAKEGFARMESEKNRRIVPGYGSSGRAGGDVPDTRPGVPLGGVRSVPIGPAPPPPPNPDPGHPVQFRVLARWESAKPVRLAGGPEVPELPGQFYVIRLRGLPLMPPPKTKPEEGCAESERGHAAGDSARQPAGAQGQTRAFRVTICSRGRGPRRPRCCSSFRAERTRSKWRIS